MAIPKGTKKYKFRIEFKQNRAITPDRINKKKLVFL